MTENEPRTWPQSSKSIPDNQNIGVAFMSPLAGEDGVCVAAALHHGRSRRAAERLKRLQHAAAMLHCVQDTGTATCNAVNYRAGTVAPCKQQEKNSGVHPSTETRKLDCCCVCWVLGGLWITPW